VITVTTQPGGVFVGAVGRLDPSPFPFPSGPLPLPERSVVSKVLGEREGDGPVAGETLHPAASGSGVRSDY